VTDQGWVALDKRLIGTMSTINRPYSVVEAMFSFSVDKNRGKELTERGYATLWGWSRNKVRSFIKNIQTTKGHMVDRKGTSSGPLVSFIDLRLQGEEDHNGTNDRPLVDHKRDTTIKNKNKNKNKKENNTHFCACDFLLKIGVEKQIAKDWLKVRKTKRLADTETALTSIMSEIEKTGKPINEILKICCVKGWGGFKISWDWQKEINTSADPEVDYWNQPGWSGGK